MDQDFAASWADMLQAWHSIWLNPTAWRDLGVERSARPVAGAEQLDEWASGREWLVGSALAARLLQQRGHLTQFARLLRHLLEASRQAEAKGLAPDMALQQGLDEVRRALPQMAPALGAMAMGGEWLQTGAEPPWWRQFTLMLDAVGLRGREWEHQRQEVLRQAQQMGRAGHRWAQLIDGVGEAAWEGFGLRLREAQEQGERYESLLALFELWVEAREAAYADLVHSERYARVYGDWANAANRMREDLLALVSEQAQWFGLTTRKDVDEAQARVRALQAEVTQLRQEMEQMRAAELGALREELRALREAQARHDSDGEGHQ